MELERYASLLWRWLWLIALASALGGGSSYMVTGSMPKIYEASTTLLVNQAQTPGSVVYSDVLTSQMLTKTYVEMVRKRPVLEAAAAALKLPGGPDQLKSMITVQVVRDTMLLELRAGSTSPQDAADAANAVGAAFIEVNRTSQMGQASQSRNALQEQLQSLEKDMRATAGQLDRLRSDQGSNGSDARQAEIARLQNILSQYQLTYSQLLKSDQDMRLAESKVYGSVVVAEPAVVPTSPVRPNVFQNVALAATVGLMLAVGIALLIEFLDDTVKSGEVVLKVLGVPTLGYVMRFRKRDLGVVSSVTRMNSRSPVVEAFRVLRTNLQFSLMDRPGRALLVTSASPGEGKTTVAVNLGLVLAQAGKRVLLVDTDLRRPGVHRYLNLKNDQGVTTVLLDPSSLDSVIQSTDVPNLSVLTSGPLPPNPSELLGSPRMAALVESLKTRADVVLFDSPPSLVVTDPSVLARRMDGVMLVVDTGSTRVDALGRAKEVLERASGSGKLLGAVLNKLTPRTAGHYYYYYYYYYYGHGTSGDSGKGNGNSASVKDVGAGRLPR